MIMKNKFLLGIAFLLPAVILTACSDSDDPDNPDTPGISEETRVIKAGDETFTQLLEDDKIREEVIDKVYNFGEEDFQLLFHVTQSHTVDGIEVEEGPADLNCAFLTMNMEEHVRFIRFFAVALGISESDKLTDEQKLEAYTKLSGILYCTGMELPLIVYLTQDDPDQLRALVRMTESVSPTRSFNNPVNDLNDIARQMLRMDIKPTDLLAQLEEEGTDFGSFLEMADRQGYQVAQLLSARSVLHAVKLVINGLVYASKIIIAIIEGSKPVVNLESTYGSYLCEEDLEPLNYYGSSMTRTPEYEFRYGCAGAPLAQAKVYLEAYINAKHRTIPGLYISRLGLLVTKVVCSGGMHVEGDMEFNTPDNIGTEENPVAYVKNTVKIDYGDCCCFSRHGSITYGLSADKGFENINYKKS